MARKFRKHKLAMTSTIILLIFYLTAIFGNFVAPQGTEQFDGLIFHMGTRVVEGQLLTNGGRVLMCICTGENLQAARDKVYAELQKIHCDNLFHRNDIAHWAL